MHDPLFKKPGSSRWWCRVPNPKGGKHLRFTTGQQDRRAAIIEWRRLCRESVTRSDPTKNETSLGDALDRRIEERRAAGRAEGTIDSLTKKARQVSRVLGSETLMSEIDALAVDAFIATRLKDGAERTTIAKELSALRGAMKLARRQEFVVRPVEDVMPLDFSPGYKPRERALSEREISKLLMALPAKRAALVAFLLATGATYPSEVVNLRKSDINLTKWMVRLRGTKRDTRDRLVPIVRFARPWLRRAMPYAPFEPWSNVRRDLESACERAGIMRCSPNDLRRSIATLMRARGVEPSLIGAYLGHADSRMAERVYGRLAPEQLAHLLDARLRASRGPAKKKRGRNAA